MIELKKGKYKIYHIPGVKIGCTTNVKKRVEEEQGYKPSEYDILYETDDIVEASEAERNLQKELKYKTDIKLYKDLFRKKMNKHSSSQATTTFKISPNDINAEFLKDITLELPEGVFELNNEDYIDWILNNVHASQFGPGTCYIYNKAFTKAFKPNSTSAFNKIRDWAKDRNLYQKGDSKTQYVKLMEEAGELAQALLKQNKPEIKDAIGDMVIVLANLSELEGFKIEDCINESFNVISKRTGKMVNGTFVKDE
jgi:NTP pyrophosphatase (non-canonical NTP hydrolase)